MTGVQSPVYSRDSDSGRVGGMFGSASTPSPIDILITHMPVAGHFDLTPDGRQ